MVIRPAALEDMEEVRALFREYQAWVNDDVCFQSFEQEVQGLPGAYAREGRGALLVAVEEQIAGCVCLRALEDRVAEMKRLFLREAFRRRGVGAKLVAAAIEEAAGLGYESLRLDTLPKMEAAHRLYESFGFTDIERYNSTAVGKSRFMEKKLG